MRKSGSIHHGMVPALGPPKGGTLANILFGHFYSLAETVNSGLRLQALLSRGFVFCVKPLGFAYPNFYWRIENPSRLNVTFDFWLS